MQEPTPPPSRLSRIAIAGTWLIAAAAVILILLVTASSADGGTYRAAQCNPDLGAGRADASFTRNSDHYVSKADCEGDGGLVVRHSSTNSQRDRWGSWSLEAPEGAEFVAFAAKVAGTAASGHVPALLAAVGAGDPERFGRVVPTADTTRWTGEGGERFEARLACSRSRCGEGETARVMMRRIALRISDTERPEASLAGPLAGRRTVRGTQALDALATDLGGGVRRLYLEVNGKPIGARKVPCQLRRQVALRLRPCPTETERRWELDTTGRGFRQGLNRIRVCADDLAFGGQRNRSCARHKARVDNECPVDGGGEAGLLRARIAGIGERGSIPRDRRARAVGTLTDASGAGIAGAEVCVATEVFPGDGPERVVATPTTGPGGRFEVRLAPGPTRDVRVAHWRDTDHLAERQMRLLVRARPTLSVSPAGTLRNGDEARFEVRVHGPDAGGRRVQLEVRTGDHWTIVRAHSSDASGRWQDAYRFTSTTGTRTYRFRALVPKQPGYPYERGWSEVRRVRVRG